MYVWFVYLHLIGLGIFLMAHGTSAFVSFGMRRQRDPAVVSAYLRISQIGTGVAYGGLLLLLIGGIGAATVGDLWSRPWIWASAIVLLVVLVGMYAVAASYYYPLRDAVAGKDGATPIEGDALAAALDSRRPEALALIGGVGLLVLVGLMVLKPG